MTLEAQVDRLFAQWARLDSPGAALAVIRNGEVAYKRGYGAANLEYDIRITPSTVFDIASVSKQFGAMAIATLAQEGKLALDDDIRRHLPDVPDFGSTITVRHLVHHISGLRDWVQSFVIAGVGMDDVISFRHILKMVRRQRALNFEPGAEYLFSNTGYNLLAEIVERVTGQSFREWTAANIFDPLGMTSTHFHDDHEMIVKARAYSYTPDEHGGFKNAANNLTALASSSLHTTVEDLAKWIFNFDHGRVGGPAVLEQMHQQGVLNSGERIAYAFGQSIGEYRGLRTVDHGGSWRGFRSTLLRFPEQRFAVVILANLSACEPAGIARRIADLYLGDLMSPETSEAKPADVTEASDQGATRLTPEALAALVGDYHAAELDTTYTIVLRDAQLVAQHFRHDDIPLTQAGDQFVSDAWFFPQIRFTRDAADGVVGFTLSGGRVRNLRFDKR